MHKRILGFTFIILLLSVFLVSVPLKAQTYRLSQEWKIGASIGATKFYGDLTDNANSFINNTPFSSYFYQDRKAAGFLFFEKWFTPFVGARFMYFGGDLQSTQESTKQYFKARYLDYSLSLTLDFAAMIWGPNPGRNVRFYGFGGIGYSQSQTTKYDLNTDEIIGTSGYGEPKRAGKGVQPLGSLVFPAGLGLSFFSYGPLSVSVEAHLHFVKTNMLDATPVDGTSFEKVGFISVGVIYNFNMNGLWIGGGNYKTFEGRSNDPALREFNKRKRVVMNTRYNRKAFKKRKKFKHQRY